MSGNGELKKADKDLLNAIQSGSALKHADTAEKNSLPSAEVISQEKTIKGIEGFDKNQLKHGETQEKQGWKEAVSQENTLKGIESFNKLQLKPGETQEKQGWKEALIHEKTTPLVTKFDKTNLKHTETAEKNPLPDVTVIDQEKKEVELRNSIGKFDKGNMNKVDVSEGCAMKEMIAQEQTHKNIESFKRSSLKHADTAEKNTLPSVADIKAEKKN